MIVTLAIIGLTVAVSLAALNNAGLMQRLILWPPAVSRGHEYWRLLSYGLVHADMAHLFFNMFTLFFFGRVMEQLLGQLMGPAAFVLLYVGGLIVSILPSYLKHQHDTGYRSLGASGAVSAVLFAFILIAPWQTLYVFVIPVPAIIFGVLYLGYTWYMDRQSKDNVNHSAHLWGAGYGILFMLLAEPKVFGVFLQQLGNPRFNF